MLGAIKIFEEAAETVPLPKPPQPIVIADYGASTGHNSLLPIGAAIAVLRKRTRPEHSVLVAHTDVAENDFTVLFRTLADDPDSYLHKDAASFASAVGRSFYTQILPSNSVNLGWTFVGDSVAQPGSGAGSRPHAGGLQRRRGREGGLRQAGRASTGTSSSRSAAVN